VERGLCRFLRLDRTELIRRKGPWCVLDDVELGPLEWVNWFNQRRLHTEPGMVPPAEFEAAHCHGTPALLAISP
jgi:putative transposase